MKNVIITSLIPLFLLSGCGGGVSNNNQGDLIDAGEDIVGTGESNFCADNVVVNTNVAGNNTYEFLVSDGQCLGTVVDDIRVEKITLPLELLNASEAEASDFVVSKNVKITKTTMSIDPDSTIYQNGAEYFVSINVKNNSGIDYRSVSINDLKLLDVNGNVIIKISASLGGKGDLYYYDKKSGSLDEIINYSMLAGSEKTFLGGYVTIDEIFDLGKIAAVTGNLRTSVFETESFFGPLNSYAMAPITPTQLEWNVENKFSYDYLSATVSFVNPLNFPIKLLNNVFTVDFFDANDYMLSRQNISLNEALGLDSEDDLTEEDYIIDASGGVFSLKYYYGPVSFSYNGEIKGTVAKAVVHLKWEPIE